MIASNITKKDGNLYFAGKNTCEMIKKYGSPLYLFDEKRIRDNMSLYIRAMKKYFGEGSFPLYASKAASFRQIYRIAKDMGMGIDVVSSGEIYTAKSVEFPLERAYFHSNNKTDADISYAIECGVGYFVADNFEELDSIDRISGDKGKTSNVLLRLTPGIDPHTYEAVATGKVDSKFGSAIDTGAAREITLYALGKKNIHLCGFHCHVGSQVFDSDVYIKSAGRMLSFISDIKKECGVTTEQLNLGGGYGVRYTENDPVIDIEKNIETVSIYIKDLCEKLGISVPDIRMEPGRSIVADAGMTLYTVGSVKRIPGYKSYVSVDGGMTDNPRFALYGSPYTVLCANKADEATSLMASVVGRCCESGDIIQENVPLPESMQRGDVLAVLTTGAYNYSMASNYNRVPRLPVIMINGDDDYIAVRRESLEDVARNDI